MLEKLELAVIEHRPDLVVTYGDTNSTLAATLAAAKLHVPLAHVEAGLRSFNRRMPEETNRIVADHLSELLFAPTPESMRNLANEGLGARASHVGDVMLDAIRAYAPVALAKSRILDRLGLQKGGYLVATLHRAENTPGDCLRPLLASLGRIGTASRPIVLPMHPRTRKSIRDAGIAMPEGRGLRPVDPLGYLDMICLVANSGIVLTDSGGLQKEAFFLGRPCVTLRTETEWVETTFAGGNLVAGTDPQKIIDAVGHWDVLLARGEPDFSEAIREAFGDGTASTRIVARILDFLATTPPA
jgi:UDP-N-acetylglucosamine 2-epimerase